MIIGRVVNGVIIGLLGYIIVNDYKKLRLLMNLERFIHIISDDVKDIKDTFDQKDFNEFLNGIDNCNTDNKRDDVSEKKFDNNVKLITKFVDEKVNEETGEVNPNLIYNDDNIEEKSSDSSSDGWKEVRTDSENNSEEKNDECDKVEVEKTTKIE